MQKQLLALVLLFSIPFLSFAQRNCGAMDHLEMMQQTYPQTIQNMEDIERHTQRYIQNHVDGDRAASITIPVVVHIIYKNGSQNVSDAQVLSQIQVLNEDFTRTNGDADNTWPQAADVDIDFCLASTDPSGNPTNGIQRRQTNKPSFGANDGMKRNNSGGLDAWPAGDYLNLWVCNLSGTLLGYAQFPGGNATTDGVVIDYAYFGSGGSAQAPFDLGRTATHEVGHWLNLRHIWGDGGCSVDDFVSDTPLSDASNGGCAIGHVSCGSVDMVQNYMDYSNDACMNLFTSGQSARMNALFSPGGARASLVNSNGCGGGGGPTCTDGVQNGDETGIDCGGSVCAPCNTGGTCDTPTGTSASNIKRKRATLNWNAVSSANSYAVQVRAAGGTWQDFSTSNTSQTVSGLSNNTTYEWRVAANCGSDQSAYSDICSFIAGNSGSGACGSNRLMSAEELTLFPNPAKDYVEIQIPEEMTQGAMLRIIDAYGQSIYVETIQATHHNIDVSTYSNGIYFLQLAQADGSIVVKKFVINK